MIEGCKDQIIGLSQSAVEVEYDAGESVHGEKIYQKKEGVTKERGINLAAALALHFFYYNFMRLHETIRVTPAMQAVISKHLMTWEEFLERGYKQNEAA